MDTYRVATRSPEGHQYLGDCLLTKEEFMELMTEHERDEHGFGSWSSDDGFEFWPVKTTGE